MYELDAEIPQMCSKVGQVKNVFENVPHYLNSRHVDIRVRAETVKAFAAGIKWHRLLDIGCGDGTVSLPLLTPESHLTLLDLSSNMAAVTQAKVPEALTSNVEVRNENFMTVSFEPGSFDLIVSVGVIAHVDSPEEFVSKIAQLLVPGGSVIVEFTDCRHVVGRLGRFLGSVKEVFRPAQYSTNRLSFPDMARIFGSHHLRLVSIFRYATIPIPGIERLLSQDKLFTLKKFMFGSADTNKNAWLGNEYICLLTAE